MSNTFCVSPGTVNIHRSHEYIAAPTLFYITDKIIRFNGIYRWRSGTKKCRIFSVKSIRDGQINAGIQIDGILLSIMLDFWAEFYWQPQNNVSRMTCVFWTKLTVLILRWRRKRSTIIVLTKDPFESRSSIQHQHGWWTPYDLVILSGK